ncbi:tRNA 2-thiouridine(34) synthase MnmA, partial [Candidatus Thioglobus sp.]|nr:tRNA 2-thiouridine(34) synthase MnmA [Candidatus Thioglobus sp.]
MAKIRYRQDSQECNVVKDGNSIKVIFKNPQRAITPGQSIVFYQEDICLGGGIIEKRSNE